MLKRREKWKAEKKWRRTGSREDMLAYKVKKNNVNALMNESRHKFYHNFIRIIATVSATYFWQQRSHSTRGITGRCIHLWTISVTWQINWELSLFRKLRPLVPISITWRKGYQHSPMTMPKYHLPPPLSKFSLITEEKVHKLINSSTNKSCTLDPMPTSLVIDCIYVLLPIITKVINLSLGSGLFTDDWKCALVLPLLKKPGLDLLFKNYRPVSNLQYVSKLTERMVFEQIHTHMMTHSLYPEFQSAYRKNHSTETALVRVTNDILMKMNIQEVTLLVMLDLSATFDTLIITSSLLV